MRFVIGIPQKLIIRHYYLLKSFRFEVSVKFDRNLITSEKFRPSGGSALF